MGTPSVNAHSDATRRFRIWLSWIFLGLGLLGHLLSARAIGGTYVAFRDHIAGFVILLLVSGAIVGVLGWRFWRGRNDITLLIIGAVQALLGLLVYLERFGVHG
jgi:hypothetical protein